jgi:hypothetical protein
MNGQLEAVGQQSLHHKLLLVPGLITAQSLPLLVNGCIGLGINVESNGV